MEHHLPAGPSVGIWAAQALPRAAPGFCSTCWEIGHACPLVATPGIAPLRDFHGLTLPESSTSQSVGFGPVSSLINPANRVTETGNTVFLEYTSPWNVGVTCTSQRILLLGILNLGPARNLQVQPQRWIPFPLGSPDQKSLWSFTTLSLSLLSKK